MLKMLVKKPDEKEIAGTSSWGTWSKEPSEFPWHYSDKETCYILEGSAEVTDEQGNKISFGPGDWVEFQEGLSCTWKVKETVKKRYMFG